MCDMEMCRYHRQCKNTAKNGVCKDVKPIPNLDILKRMLANICPEGFMRTDKIDGELIWYTGYRTEDGRVVHL